MSQHPNLTVIGFMGAAESGKNTAAKLVADNLAGDYEAIIETAFATPLKQAVYNLDPVIDTKETGEQIRLAKEVDLNGWDYTKHTYPEARRLLQKMGTEVGRELFGEDFWVKTLLKDVQYRAEGKTLVLITDVRFENEVESIKEFENHLLVHLSRGENSLGDTERSHASERDLSHLADVRINNTGSLDDLDKVLRETIRVYAPQAIQEKDNDDQE